MTVTHAKGLTTQPTEWREHFNIIITIIIVLIIIVYFYLKKWYSRRKKSLNVTLDKP